MKYSRVIDQVAMSVARRLFKRGTQDLSCPRRNPLFYPCLVAFTLLGVCMASPVDLVLKHATINWLPSPIVTWGLLLCLIYPLARFCTTLFALRVR